MKAVMSLSHHCFRGGLVCVALQSLLGGRLSPIDALAMTLGRRRGPYLDHRSTSCLAKGALSHLILKIKDTHQAAIYLTSNLDLLFRCCRNQDVALSNVVEDSVISTKAGPAP